MVKKSEQRKKDLIELLKARKVCLRKITIMLEFDWSKYQVDKACRELRKEKIVSMHKRKYWGLIES